MKKYTEYYDLMAPIIRKIVDSKIDPIQFDTYMHHNKQAELFSKVSSESNLIGIIEAKLKEPPSIDNSYFLLLVLQHLDHIAFEAFDNYSRRTADNGDYCLEFESLNSKESVDSTHIIIFPKGKSIWEGKSGESNHKRSLNNYIDNSSFVTLDVVLEMKHPILFHYLDSRLFDIKETDSNGYKYVRLAASPIADDYEVKPSYKEIDGCLYFLVDKVESNYPGDCNKRILDIIREVDADIDACGHGIDILILPEMLGTKELTNHITSELSHRPTNNIKLIVLPSIWAYDENTSMGRNYCDVITCDGTILFSQDKLIRFLYVHKDEDDYDEKSLELIEADQTIHILFAKQIGAICVLICASELINSLRWFITSCLEVNLILAPSFATGSFEFKRSAMAGAEMDCNTVWCNTCSGLDESKTSHDAKDVCFITTYTKNTGIGTEKLEMTSNVFNKDDSHCDIRCRRGNACYFHRPISSATKEGEILYGRNVIN